jgi:pimeloyl-ACP methyl ester carboxylesterase
MPKIKANGVNLHYITVGTGPDIVMLHGFLGNLAVWHLYMAPILRREHRVTTYDLRGHGYSDVTPNHYTAADMVEDLRCLLDALSIEKPILVGHSFGADIAMYFSLLYPERVPKLVALEPGLAALVHLRQDKDWIGWAAWVAKLEEAFTCWKTGAPTPNICWNLVWRRLSSTVRRAGCRAIASRCST